MAARSGSPTGPSCTGPPPRDSRRSRSGSAKAVSCRYVRASRGPPPARPRTHRRPVPGRIAAAGRPAPAAPARTLPIAGDVPDHRHTRAKLRGMASSPREELLGDDVTRVVRVGDTVRRPVRPFTATVQAYLAHLHRQGFTAAPLPLGVDEQGREVLSFVPGWVPREPLHGETAAEDVLAGLARRFRRRPGRPAAGRTLGRACRRGP